jgi:hypothetical protein
MQIALTEETRALLDDDFLTEPLGEVEIRGFGRLQLHALAGERPR